MHDRDDRLPADAARAALGVPAGPRVVGLQLGAGANYDVGPLRQAILDDLAGRPDVHVVEIVSPIAALPPRADGSEPRALYPLYPVSSAFDLLITNAGYNSFHECTLGGVPSVFVPVEGRTWTIRHCGPPMRRRPVSGWCSG